MARAKLSSLIGNLEDPAAHEAAAVEPAVASPPLQSVPGESPAPAQEQPAEAQPAAAPAPADDQAPESSSTKVATAKGRSKAKPASKKDEPAPQQAPGPRYLELTRKEARFTEAQLDELTVLRRKINRGRAGRGELITENTLIRVAVDLLLHESETVLGKDAPITEDEIRHRLSVPKTTRS